MDVLKPCTSAQASFPPSCPECLLAATRREPARLRRAYQPSDAPSLLSVEAHSSVLRPSVLRSFKLALLKGRRSLPAITSPQRNPTASSNMASHMPLSPLAKVNAPTTPPRSSLSVSFNSASYSSKLPVSPPRLSLSASTPLPEPAHVLQPTLKRAASLISSDASSNKRQRPSAVSLPLPARDVRADKELAALWIARELVQWSGQYKIVEEGAEEGERSAGSTPQSLEGMEDESSDGSSYGSDSDGESLSGSESGSCHLSVHVEDETGQELPRWLSASQLQERELVRQLSLGKPNPAATEQLPGELPQLEQMDSLASVESVPVSGMPEEHIDADLDEQQSSAQQMPSATTFSLPLPSVTSSVSIPVLSAESLLSTLRASFESRAGEPAQAFTTVKTYMPHPLSMMQAVKSASMSLIDSSSASAVTSSAFSSPTASSLSYYVAPSMSSFSSTLFSSSFAAPPPSSPLVLKSVTLPLPSLSSSFSFPYLNSSDPRSSFSLYPTAAVAADGGTSVSSPSAVAMSSGGSFSMTSPFNSLAYGRDVSSGFSLS